MNWIKASIIRIHVLFFFFFIENVYSRFSIPPVCVCVGGGLSFFFPKIIIPYTCIGYLDKCHTIAFNALISFVFVLLKLLSHINIAKTMNSDEREMYAVAMSAINPRK